MLEQQTAEGNAAWERLALSQRQWNAVCSHEAKNRQIKSLWRRMVNVDGAARTLIGSYRHGFHRQSQFVLPLNGAGLVTAAIDTATATATSKEVVAGCNVDDDYRDGDGGGGGGSGDSCDGDGSGGGSGGGSEINGGGGGGDGDSSGRGRARVDAVAVAVPAPVRLPRFFSTRECARLQGFPDDFVLPAGYGR